MRKPSKFAFSSVLMAIFIRFKSKKTNLLKKSEVCLMSEGRGPRSVMKISKFIRVMFESPRLLFFGFFRIWDRVMFKDFS